MGKLIRDNLYCKIRNLLNPSIAPINCLDIGEDKKFLAVSTLSSTLYLYDNSIGDLVSEYKGHHKSDQYHSSVKFSKDQSYLI